MESDAGYLDMPMTLEELETIIAAAETENQQQNKSLAPENPRPKGKQLESVRPIKNRRRILQRVPPIKIRPPRPTARDANGKFKKSSLNARSSTTGTTRTPETSDQPQPEPVVTQPQPETVEMEPQYELIAVPSGAAIPPEAIFVQPTAEELASFIFTNSILPHLTSASSSPLHNQCQENIFRTYYLPQLISFLQSSLAHRSLSYKEINSLVSSSLTLLGYN